MNPRTGFESVIGQTLQVIGEVTGDNVRIDGHVTAPVTINDKVLVGDTGVVIGDIKAQSVEISGHVTGDIRAHTVSLMENATVKGNIAAWDFSSHVGCSIEGTIIVTKNAQSDESDENEPIT